MHPGPFAHLRAVRTAVRHARLRFFFRFCFFLVFSSFLSASCAAIAWYAASSSLAQSDSATTWEGDAFGCAGASVLCAAASQLGCGGHQDVTVSSTKMGKRARLRMDTGPLTSSHNAAPSSLEVPSCARSRCSTAASSAGCAEAHRVPVFITTRASFSSSSRDTAVPPRSVPPQGASRCPERSARVASSAV